MVCSVLSQTSEDEADQVGHPGDCRPRWSAATAYLVHAVSWLQVYKQVPSRSGPLILLFPPHLSYFDFIDF